MIPNKILWYLGYNNLGLMLEQERKHWLLKTDKRKQIQDKITGDIFEGVLDNRGSDIIIRTGKLPIKNTIIPTLKFVDSSSNEILEFGNAAFPFSMGCKGLTIARIKSVLYPMGTLDDIQYKNYRVMFESTEKRSLAFGVSPNSNEVYSGEWLVTDVAPTLQLMNDLGEYTINITLNITDATNGKYYYPLEPGLQPFEIVEIGQNKYVSQSINDDGYIGYPLFWFTTDQTRTGPTVELGPNGYNVSNMAYMVFSTEGNSGSMYNGKAYVNVDGTSTEGATPDLTLPEYWEIRCECLSTDTFIDSDADFDKSIDIDNIYFYNKNTGNPTTIQIISGNDEDNVLKMTRNVGWEFIDDHTYKIDMELFLTNNQLQSGSKSPLIPLFDVYLDTNIPYYIEDDSTLGYAGIEFTASNPTSDDGMRYPYDLDKWEGLPSWYAESEGTPQHMAIYAIHNTPMYSPQIPDSRQVAALLLDPGKMKVEDSEELENDEIGRIYVISNDDPEYVNNAMTKYPKPARTVARICDIPTSVSDFLNVEGLIPISVVDPKYVRNQAAYTTDEKDRLWNVLNSKVVTPMATDASGVPFYVPEGATREPYPYIWYSLDNLKEVDLVNNNDFRKWVNLNSMVDPQYVSVYDIADGGTDYVVNATGIVIIGGVAMNYVVNEVDESTGEVLDVSVFPQDNETFINLSNFDMAGIGDTGITQVYGTTPIASEIGGVEIPKTGEGLKITLIIDHYSELKMRRGDIYDDLVAFVYENNGLWLYRYVNQTSRPLHQGFWGIPMKVTQFDKTTTKKDGGGYSSTDALTRSILPYAKNINVCIDSEGSGLEPILTMSTPTFINIIDTTHSPIHLSGEYESSLIHVDLCGYHCEGLSTLTVSSSDNDNIVLEAIKNKVSLDRDCYLIWRRHGSNSVKFGIVRRSMNNYVTTDTTTTIPPTDNMLYNSYINTNEGTTVVWNVPEFGPMMWVYNQNYNRKEIYNINQDTRDFYVSYSNEEDPNKPNIMSWNDIDIKPAPGSLIEKIISDDNKFRFTIYTNNPVQGELKTSVPAYENYEFKLIAHEGDTVTNSTPTPVGNWQLVFPRVNQYRIVSSGIQEGVYNTEVKLRRLVPLRGEDLGNVSTVIDSNGNNINAKVVLFDEGTTGTKMKIWNKETGQFEIV